MVDPNSKNYFANLNTIFNTTELRGSRIYLRRLKNSDINDFYVGFFRNTELVKYMYQTTRAIDSQNLIDELKSGEDTNNFHIYGIFDSIKNLCIGNIRVGYITHRHKISDLAIFIGHPDYVGKGFATEAIALGNQLCFDIYDFRKLHGGMFEENIASVKAYLKTGWVVEGRLRGQYWVQEKRMDRIAVACFNPNYFDKAFLTKVEQLSAVHLKDLF